MKSIHVVAAAIFDTKGRLVISKRLDHLHQGGLWEFPGGKVESNETVEDALKRELREEINILPEAYRPLIRVHHDYGDKKILLDVWLVSEFIGEPQGLEQQEVQHIELRDIHHYDFPAANKPILKALLLPCCIAISGQFIDVRDACEKTELVLKNRKIDAFHFRAPFLSDDEYMVVARELQNICEAKDIPFFVNRSYKIYKALNADGLHVSQSEFKKLTLAQVRDVSLMGVSCHTAAELASAVSMGADYGFLSPIKPTNTHINTNAIGWEKFQTLVDEQSIPVYGLGGMSVNDLALSYQYGAQGVAAIAAFWPA